MNAPRHLLLTGIVGTGKSTLVNKLLQENRRPLYGFVTKRLAPDGAGLSHVYMHRPTDAIRGYTQDNLVGSCDAQRSYRNPQVFNTLGISLLRAPEEGLILMDELGFLENGAYAFCEDVLGKLDGDIPVLAVVKQRQTPFLDAVRAHPNTRLVCVTAENRDALYETLLPVIREWNET